MATAGSITAKAALILNDPTNIRWTSTELLDWLNDGQREICIHRPDAATRTISHKLYPDRTQQWLPNAPGALVTVTPVGGGSVPTPPATGTTLVAITRNLGGTGGTAGPVIRLTSREVLDTTVPGWHSAENTLGYIQHYTYDPRDPRTFYVYPRAPSDAWYVEMIYTCEPTDCASNSSALFIPDIYSQVLVDYVTYRAYSKDAEFAQNAQLAVAHYTAFANALGIGAKGAAATNPNVMDGAAFNPTLPKRS